MEPTFYLAQAMKNVNLNISKNYIAYKNRNESKHWNMRRMNGIVYALLSTIITLLFVSCNETENRISHDYNESFYIFSDYFIASEVGDVVFIDTTIFGVVEGIIICDTCKKQYIQYSLKIDTKKEAFPRFLFFQHDTYGNDIMVFTNEHVHGRETKFKTTPYGSSSFLVTQLTDSSNEQYGNNSNLVKTQYLDSIRFKKFKETKVVVKEKNNPWIPVW
jgi:hypothetical protein